MVERGCSWNPFLNDKKKRFSRGLVRADYLINKSIFPPSNPISTFILDKYESLLPYSSSANPKSHERSLSPFWKCPLLNYLNYFSLDNSISGHV